MVEDDYGRIWSGSLEEQLGDPKPMAFEWSRGAFTAPSIARKRVHQLLLRDWNAEGMRHHYIVGNQYFDASLDEFETAGLKPVFVLDDIPNKVSFHVGLVVAEIT